MKRKNGMYIVILLDIILLAALLVTFASASLDNPSKFPSLHLPPLPDRFQDDHNPWPVMKLLNFEGASSGRSSSRSAVKATTPTTGAECISNTSGVMANVSIPIASAETAIEVTPVSATTTLQITSGNLNILAGYPDGAYSGKELLWSFGKSLDVACSVPSCTNKRGFPLNNPIYTQLADNNGKLWGECVSAVKALAKSDVVTSQWIMGTQVVKGGISSGTVIATFSGGKYTSSGHTAIFKSYDYDATGSITGIEVWDQNWFLPTGYGCAGCKTGVVGKHTILRSGSGVNNANNYYTVLLESIINLPPNTPTLLGPILGVTGVSYDYSATATDPNPLDQLSYTFKWDGGETITTSSVAFGKCNKSSHTWSTAGTHQVTAMATDSKGASSEWSSPLEVTVSVPPTDTEKQQLVLGWVNKHRNDGGNYWPPEVILAMIFREGGRDAFFTTTNNDPNNFYKGYPYGPWTEPDNTRLYCNHDFFSDGIMQVTSQNSCKGSKYNPGSGCAGKSGYGFKDPYNYDCKIFGGYFFDQSGYEGGIDDGIYCLDGWNPKNTGYINAILHYNSGGKSISLYKSGGGDPTYLGHIANQLSSAVPSTYPGLSNPGWVSALRLGQSYLDIAMSNAKIPKDYAKYQATLEAQLKAINLPPNTPDVPSGSTSGFTNVPYDYSTKTTDSNGDQVSYTFDWEDGQPQTGLAASASHKWVNVGTYHVKVMATDSKETPSPWSDSLTVTITNAADVCPHGCKYSAIQATVDAANPYDTINVAEGTYKENVHIDKSLTIKGAGAGKTIIDGGLADSVFIIGITDDNIDVALTGMTIRNGKAEKTSPYGGGILNEGRLTITDCTISGNSADWHGGDIHNYGTTTITGSTISGNSVPLPGNSYYDGGGVYNGGTMTITDSTISENSAFEGGGVYNGGTMTITNSKISGNVATGAGGGIQNYRSLSIDGTTQIINNQASFGYGGGIYSVWGAVSFDGMNVAVKFNKAHIPPSELSWYQGLGVYLEKGTPTITGGFDPTTQVTGSTLI